MLRYPTDGRLLVEDVDLNSAFNSLTVLHSSAFLHTMYATSLFHLQNISNKSEWSTFTLYETAKTSSIYF